MIFIDLFKREYKYKKYYIIKKYYYFFKRMKKFNKGVNILINIQ